jgi:integrase
MARYKDSTRDWIYISDEDARKVIENAAPRWRLPILILYHYGLRASEVTYLRPENLKDNTLVIQRLKGGKLTKQIIVPEIAELVELAKRTPPGCRIFPFGGKTPRIMLWWHIQRAGNLAGVDRVFLHPHAFRHRCGRRWARMGTPHELMAMMGHRTMAASLMYTQLSCDEQLSRKFLG